jgi:hypothetical protein
VTFVGFTASCKSTCICCTCTVVHCTICHGLLPVLDRNKELRQLFKTQEKIWLEFSSTTDSGTATQMIHARWPQAKSLDNIRAALGSSRGFGDLFTRAVFLGQIRAGQVTYTRRISAARTIEVTPCHTTKHSAGQNRPCSTRSNGVGLAAHRPCLTTQTGKTLARTLSARPWCSCARSSSRSGAGVRHQGRSGGALSELLHQGR